MAEQGESGGGDRECGVAHQTVRETETQAAVDLAEGPGHLGILELERPSKIICLSHPILKMSPRQIK